MFNNLEKIGLREFLKTYPYMSVRPQADSTQIILEGKFEFAAKTEPHPQIQDSYLLRIQVPLNFPRELPKVFEIGGRIRRASYNHVSKDDSLCLGTPLRLLIILKEDPTLLGFVERCLIPYLYSISCGTFIFGEVEHGPIGAITDYKDLFELKSLDQTKSVLQYLGMKEREANKLLCPCGCQRRLGKCSFNKKLREIRGLNSRKWFRSKILS